MYGVILSEPSSFFNVLTKKSIELYSGGFHFNNDFHEVKFLKWHQK